MLSVLAYSPTVFSQKKPGGWLSSHHALAVQRAQLRTAWRRQENLARIQRDLSKRNLDQLSKLNNSLKNTSKYKFWKDAVRRDLIQPKPGMKLRPNMPGTKDVDRSEHLSKLAKDRRSMRTHFLNSSVAKIADTPSSKLSKALSAKPEKGKVAAERLKGLFSGAYNDSASRLK